MRTLPAQWKRISINQSRYSYFSKRKENMPGWLSNDSSTYDASFEQLCPDPACRVSILIITEQTTQPKYHSSNPLGKSEGFPSPASIDISSKERIFGVRKPTNIPLHSGQASATRSTPCNNITSMLNPLTQFFSLLSHFTTAGLKGLLNKLL